MPITHATPATPGGISGPQWEADHVGSAGAASPVQTFDIYFDTAGTDYPGLALVTLPAGTLTSFFAIVVLIPWDTPDAEFGVATASDVFITKAITDGNEDTKPSGDLSTLSPSSPAVALTEVILKGYISQTGTPTRGHLRVYGVIYEP